MFEIWIKKNHFKQFSIIKKSNQRIFILITYWIYQNCDSIEFSKWNNFFLQTSTLLTNSLKMKIFRKICHDFMRAKCVLHAIENMHTTCKWIRSHDDKKKTKRIMIIRLYRIRCLFIWKICKKKKWIRYNRIRFKWIF